MTCARTAPIRYLIAAAALFLAGCGGSDELPVLGIQVDGVAITTSATAIEVTGTLTRTPPSTTPVTIVATGGAGSATVSIAPGRFTIVVPLTPDTLNSIVLKATEAGGLEASLTLAFRREPATLALVLDATPVLTSETDVQLTGTVLRTPANSAPIFVTLSGGGGGAVDTVTDGHFSLLATVPANVTSTIKLLARDNFAAVKDSIVLDVRHDGVAPSIVLATPANLMDGVDAGTTGTVTVQLSEAVALGEDGGLDLTQQGLPVPGVTSLSDDSTTLTFTPAISLSPNAIYRVGFRNVADPAGNLVAFGASSCFVTSLTGVDASFTATDSTADVYASTPPPAIAAPDLTAVRFARVGDTLSGVFQFSAPRSFVPGGEDRAEIFIDLDTDQDSTTGYVTLKDTLFRNSGPPLDTISSGTGAEYVIGLSPLPAAGDLAYVGLYTGPLYFQVVTTFQPGVCGSFMGFGIPFSRVDDDGVLNAVVMGYAGSGNSIFVDPLPTSGSMELNFAPPGPVARRSSPLAPLPYGRGGISLIGRGFAPSPWLRGVKPLRLSASQAASPSRGP